MVHPWCQDVPRDEAVRAAEDAAAKERQPLPEWRDLPERVARLEALLSRSGKNADSDGDLGSKCTERESAADAEPVADLWGVQYVHRDTISDLSVRETKAEAIRLLENSGGIGTVVPLYRAPPPPRGWLTAEEREAVETARDYFDDDDHGDSECVFIARVLKQLLARNSPPKVRLPADPECSTVADYGRAWRECVDAVRAALKEAGVEVSE